MVLFNSDTSLYEHTMIWRKMWIIVLQLYVLRLFCYTLPETAIKLSEIGDCYYLSAG